MKIITTLPALAALAVTPAVGEETLDHHGHRNGSEYVSHCMSNDPVFKMDCFSYVHGIADGLSMWNANSPETAKICMPEKISALQKADVAVRFIQANQHRAHYPAAALIMVAFMREWPCNGGQQ